MKNYIEICKVHREWEKLYGRMCGENMKRFFLMTVFVLILAVLAACGSNDEAQVTDQENVNIKELVNDYSLGNRKDQAASITSHELIVTNSDNSQEIYDISEEEFFVSIAPYVNETHP